jgi:N6-L-threonylcarbamoyladenine synthase
VRVLGIETSCDETAAAVVEDGRRLCAQAVASQVDIHARFGGVVPEVASRRHVEAVTAVTEAALRKAGMTLADVDAIAVTCGPGLLGALLVGVSAAKGFALATGLPLIGVHHIAGHVAAAFVGTDIKPPLLALVVSGGHTELLAVDENFGFRRLGGTKDDAAGEAYDKVARLLGLAYPGGPKVDALAQRGRPDAYAFPRSMMEDDGFDFSFSGLKTAVWHELEKHRRRGEAVPVEDVCASFQQAVIDVLVEKTARAVRETGLRTVIAAGGVAANQGLRAALAARAEADGFTVHVPPVALCTDNGAMIAAAGYFALQRGQRSDLALNAHAVLSLEDWQAGRV